MDPTSSVDGKSVLFWDLLVVFGCPSLIMGTCFILWKWCIRRKLTPNSSAFSGGLPWWAIFGWPWTQNVCHERLHTTRMGGNNECGRIHSEGMEHNRRDKLGYAIQFENVTSPNTIIEVVPLQHLWLQPKFPYASSAVVKEAIIQQ